MLAQPRNTKISRKTTLSACAPCKISKKRCDIARPCSRCFQSRCAELCKDTILSVSMSLQTLSRFFIIISFRFFSALNDASDLQKTNISEKLQGSPEVTIIADNLHSNHRYSSSVNICSPDVNGFQSPNSAAENPTKLKRSAVFEPPLLAPGAVYTTNMSDFVRQKPQQMNAPPAIKRRRLCIHESPVMPKSLAPIQCPIAMSRPMDPSAAFLALSEPFLPQVQPYWPSLPTTESAFPNTSIAATSRWPGSAAPAPRLRPIFGQTLPPPLGYPDPLQGLLLPLPLFPPCSTNQDALSGFGGCAPTLAALRGLAGDNADSGT